MGHQNETRKFMNASEVKKELNNAFFTPIELVNVEFY